MGWRIYGDLALINMLTFTNDVCCKCLLSLSLDHNFAVYSIKHYVDYL